VSLFTVAGSLIWNTVLVTLGWLARDFIVANLHHLMVHAGPDCYRLAHIEAGIVAQRLYIAANAMGFGCGFSGLFYDDEVRRFFGLDKSGWEVMHEVAVGVPLQPGQRHFIVYPDPPLGTGAFEAANALVSDYAPPGTQLTTPNTLAVEQG